ncbi:excalibur calcium-binding domain-containing protein [Deinococcus ficus]|uniref:excalibur calcium-binding domain-containing protein n=1 Tax=Deinococcus ficus TaxID=317577 RepID=UPI0003B5E909|nr:excalibur calcium-binding domain-containing protein [Deinococcus ficus]
MKRFLMLAVLLATAAQAATGIMTSNVNLRRTASATGAVLTVIPQGTSLTVVCTGSWCRTTYKGQSGYIARSLVRLQTSTTSLSTPAQPAQRADVFYANCTAARAAGAAPIMRGEPGSRSKLDRDNDGVACE